MVPATRASAPATSAKARPAPGANASSPPPSRRPPSSQRCSPFSARPRTRCAAGASPCAYAPRIHRPSPASAAPACGCSPTTTPTQSRTSATTDHARPIPSGAPHAPNTKPSRARPAHPPSATQRTLAARSAAGCTPTSNEHAETSRPRGMTDARANGSDRPQPPSANVTNPCRARRLGAGRSHVSDSSARPGTAWKMVSLETSGISSRTAVAAIQRSALCSRCASACPIAAQSTRRSPRARGQCGRPPRAGSCCRASASALRPSHDGSRHRATPRRSGKRRTPADQ
jgi:hypothetical protein